MFFKKGGDCLGLVGLVAEGASVSNAPGPTHTWAVIYSLPFIFRCFLFLVYAKIFFKMKNRVFIKDLKDNVGKEIIIAGWVNIRRDQGKMIFLICVI